MRMLKGHNGVLHIVEKYEGRCFHSSCGQAKGDDIDLVTVVPGEAPEGHRFCQTCERSVNASRMKSAMEVFNEQCRDHGPVAVERWLRDMGRAKR